MKTFNQFKEDYEKRGKSALRNIGNKTILINKKLQKIFSNFYS